MRLIDADALIHDTENALCKDCHRRKGRKNGKLQILYGIGEAPCRVCGIMDVLDALKDAPTVEPKRGRWVFRRYKTNPKRGNYYCSQCKWVAEPTSFCPNCGARIEGETDEERND